MMEKQILIVSPRRWWVLWNGKYHVCTPCVFQSEAFFPYPLNSSHRTHCLSVSKHTRHTKGSLRREYNSYWYEQRNSSVVIAWNTVLTVSVEFMRPVALPCLSHDRLTATNCIALEDKANTAHTSTEKCMELAGYLCRKRAIPPPPPKMLDSRRSKSMPHFMLPTVTNFISQIKAHWQSAVNFN
jgi:hypothetical protein